MRQVCTGLALIAARGLSLAVGLSAMPATAQQGMLCGLRNDIGQMLVQRFGETPQAGGVVGDRIVELLVSQTGSWTILITSTDGRSCIVTGGESWSDQPLAAPPDSKHPAKESL